MAGGPGGKEVGRVSIKIAPDSSGFIGEVRRLVREAEGQKVTIGVELDAGAARAELRALTSSLGNEKVSLNVDADTGAARAETLQTEAFIDGRNAKLNVGADTTRAMAEVDLATARIASKDATITVHVRVDDAGLGGIGNGKGGLFSGITNILGAIPNLASGAASAISGFGGTAVTAFGNVSSGATGMLGSFGSIIPVIGQAVSAFLSFGLVAGLYTVAAGAIVAAVGAVGSAISALPALAFGGAGAIGVLAIAFSNFGDALGRGNTGKALEKQNEALAKLPPAAREAALAINGPLLTAFDALRNAIQTSFFQGFADQIRDLAARVMPALTLSLQGVASSLGAMALGLAGVAFSSAGIANLNASFQGMSQLLTIITPSLQGLVQVLLQAAGTREVWQLLGEIISVVIGRVTELFAQFSAGGSSSLMVESLTQLKGVLDSASGAFVTLVVQATNFFTGAGPGLRDLFDSINRTLQEIDFRSLGESFGMFARTVGQFIDNVPPSVWQGIADSVRDLALKFQELGNDPKVQELFNSLIGAIPILIDLFTRLLDGVKLFAGFLHNMESAILGFLETIGLVEPGTRAAFDGAVNAAGGAAGPMGAAGGGVGRAAQQGVLDGMQGIDPGTRAALQRGIDAANSQAPPMGAAGESVGTAAVRGATAGMAPLPPEVLAAAARGVDNVRGQAGPMQGAGNQVGAAGATGARDGIAPMPGDMDRAAADAEARTRAHVPGFGDVGRAIVQALAGAITGGLSTVIGAAIALAGAALRAAKSVLGIASPSRVFRDEVGVQIPAGMAGGITAGTPLAVQAATTMASQVAAATQRAMATDPGLKAAAQELLNRVNGGGQIFEDLTFRGMSANLGRFNDELADMFYASGKSLQDFLTGLAATSAAVQAGQSVGQQIVVGINKSLTAIDPGLKAAALELLNRVNGGGQIFEDLTFRGMSANLGRFNDELSDMFSASGKSLKDFLTGLAATSAAVQAGQSVGQQIVVGINKALTATPYTIKAPTVPMSGAKASQAYDYITDQVRANYQTGIWNGSVSSIGGGHAPMAPQSTAEAMQNLTWTVDLDPEGLAKITAKGQRTLDRR